MNGHVRETDLALYASGDVSLWQRAAIHLHVRQCERCREVVNEFRGDAKILRDASAALPEGVDWARLSAEMTANIRVGRAMHSIWHGRSAMADERIAVIEASSEGIELRKNGGSLGVTQDAARLMTVSVSTQGSASAHYVDQDTGQVTITSVYAQ